MIFIRLDFEGECGKFEFGLEQQWLLKKFLCMDFERVLEVLVRFNEFQDVIGLVWVIQKFRSQLLYVKYGQISISYWFWYLVVFVCLEENKYWW